MIQLVLKLGIKMKNQIKSQEKQEELDRYRAIMLATLDYHLGQHAGQFVCDGVDFIADYYQQQKLQTEKYYQQRRLDRLKQRLISLTESMRNQLDFNFATYIKEKTNFDIDIFENLHKRVDKILSQNKIGSPKDYRDLSIMCRFCELTKTDLHKVDQIKSLMQLPVITTKRRTNYKDPFIENHYSEATSPDGTKKLAVEKSGKEENALTYIVIYLNGVSSGFYDVRGHHPDIKVCWKDNNSIVVETKQEYTGATKTKKIESKGDIINIEYIEV